MKPRYQGLAKAPFDGTHFANLTGPAAKGLWEVFKWKIQGTAKPWPKWVENEASPLLPSSLEVGQVAATFVNHATMLLQFRGLNVITDPVFSDRLSPVSFAGPKRIRRPGLEFAQLPKIDVVVVSHNHYDHLDIVSIRKLHDKFQPMFLVGLGDGRILEKIPGIRFQELDWWQTHDVLGAKFTYLPAQHWSARGPYDRNLSLWGSFIVEAQGCHVYFAGDTGYSHHFQLIAQKFPKIDLALLPIGAYEPRWFMKESHMNPADAVQAHQDLRAHRSVAIHFGTWQLTDEALHEPPQHLAEALVAAKVPQDHFWVLKEGETRQLQVPPKAGT